MRKIKACKPVNFYIVLFLALLDKLFVLIAALKLANNCVKKL